MNLAKTLFVHVFLLVLTGCIPGNQKSTVDIDITSSTEQKDGQLTHGCFIKASKDKRQFEQTIRFGRNDLGLIRQYSIARIFINPKTNQINLRISCKAGHPFMLESTTVDNNVFGTTGLTIRLDTEKQFASKDDGNQYLKELVQAGFSISASGVDSTSDDPSQILTDNTPFQSGTLTGVFYAPYDLLEIRSQSSPGCSRGGTFYPREFVITIPSQTPKNFSSYQYTNTAQRSVNEDSIYIPKWHASGTISGYLC